MKTILNKVFSGSRELLLNDLQDALLNNKRKVIITANSEIIMNSDVNEALYNNLLLDDTVITADGISVKVACNYINRNSVDKITGVDLVETLMNFANVHKKKIFIYGSKQTVLDLYKNIIVEQGHLDSNVEMYNGYDYKFEEVIGNLQRSKPDLILVCLGVPLQEEFSFLAKTHLEKGVFIGCGGSLDVLSGSKKRAPQVFQNLQIEWLYRIMSEPSRFSRFYSNNVKFVYRLMKEKKRNRNE